MSETKPQRVVGAPIWGIFLLFLGVVFLLQTLDVLPWGLWGTLWRFWPVLIIIVGLGILLRRYNVWLVSLIIAVALGACLGIAVWQYGLSSPGGTIATSCSHSLDGIERARVEADFTAANISISSLASSSPNLVEVKGGNMKVDFHQQGSEGRLYLSTGKADSNGINYEAKLTRNIPLVIDVMSTVGNLELDLSNLEIAELRLDIDDGNCEVTMPSSAGTTEVEIEADAANIEVTIPAEVAARIQADTDFCVFSMNENRFHKQGDYYISDAFDTAPNRIYLEIDCDVGRLRVK